jgi:hypothetical protein
MCLPRLVRSVLLSIIVSTFGAIDGLTLAQASPDGYTRVRPPTVMVEPVAIELKGGEAFVVQARPQGGEAIQFSIDWEMQEGPNAGSIEPIGGRTPEGIYQAEYKAPSEGSGPFHIIASIHEYPSSFATVLVTVRAELAQPPRER